MAVALAALVVAVGCSTLPTSPELRAPGETPALGTSGSAPAAPAGAKSVESATSSKEIHGALGGVVSAGDFTVVIPPLAISGTATVTVTQPDLSKPVVDLHITPESANQFKVPVTLIADARRMSLTQLATAYLSYYNPKTRKWEPLPESTVDLTARTVQVPLVHFSRYRVESGGKAGW